MVPVPAFRMTRATVFAAVCVTLAAAGHAAAGHTMIAPWTIVAGFGGALVVSWALAGTERSLATIAGGLLGGQFALHTLFVAGMAEPGSSMGHQGMVSGPVQDGHGGLAMTLAHSGAALICAWWLRRGERLAWALTRRAALLAAWPLRALATTLARWPVLAGPVRVLIPAVGQRRPRSPLLEHSVIRRGPPLRASALGH